jgi:hypothetical protein
MSARRFWIATRSTQVGGDTILEYWIPAEDLDALNRNIIGTIHAVTEIR